MVSSSRWTAPPAPASPPSRGGWPAPRGAAYLDTGAMYRAVTLAVLRAGLDAPEPDATVRRRSPRSSSLRSVTDPDAPRIRWAARTSRPRSAAAEVTRRGERGLGACPRCAPRWSTGSAPDREALRAPADVVEGRDIGSVVVPDAPLKVYLTASARGPGRAPRRAGPQGRAAIADFDAVLADVRRRDRLDSTRKHLAAARRRRRPGARHRRAERRRRLAELLRLVHGAGPDVTVTPA